LVFLARVFFQIGRTNLKDNRVIFNGVFANKEWRRGSLILGLDAANAPLKKSSINMIFTGKKLNANNHVKWLAVLEYHRGFDDGPLLKPSVST